MSDVELLPPAAAFHRGAPPGCDRVDNVPGFQRVEGQNCDCTPQRQADPFLNFVVHSSASTLEGEIEAAKTDWNNALTAAGSTSQLRNGPATRVVWIMVDPAVCPDWSETRVQFDQIRI